MTITQPDLLALAPEPAPIIDTARMDAARLAAGMSVATSPTSIDADRSMTAVKGTLRLAVLLWLQEHGPATDEAVQLGMGINPSTQRPRRIELVRLGKVVDTGRTAKTTSGRTAVLWAVA